MRKHSNNIYHFIEKCMHDCITFVSEIKKLLLVHLFAPTSFKLFKSKANKFTTASQL